MLKAAEYNVKDSNVENIGSDMDKAARNAAAMTECEWEGAGQVLCYSHRYRILHLKCSTPMLVVKHGTMSVCENDA
jgi:hypothetical protein